MAKVRTLQSSWRNGMKSDYPPDQMPADSARDILNMILDHGAPIRVRGGWQHHSASLGLGGNSVQAGLYATFATSGGASNAMNLAIDSLGDLYNVTTAGGAAAISGTGFTTLTQNPIFHGGTAASAASAVYTGLAIIPSGSGGSRPKKFNGTTLTDLGGTPPAALFATVYKDYTLLGNGSDGSVIRPSRVWFSPPGDPDCGFSGSVTAWDTENSWIDFSHNVAGLGATKNAVLVFGRQQVSRIRGSIPPPDEDMVVDDPLFDVGLLDAFSIVEYKDNVFWAAPEGVFRSDGVVLDDLTRKGGMSQDWRTFVESTGAARVSAGVIRDNLVVTLAGSVTFLIDLQTNAWTRHSNIDSNAYWIGRNGLRDELYWGRDDDSYVATLDDIFVATSASANKADAGGVPTIPTRLRTPFYTLGSPGLKRLRNLYLGHELIDFGSDDPSVSIAYAVRPEDTPSGLTLTALSETNSGGSGETNSHYERVRRSVNKQASGISFQFTKSGSGDFILWDLGIETHALEPSRLEQ